MADIEIKKIALDKLKPTSNNPRKISKEDLEKLKKSVAEFPEMLEAREIIVDENLRILGGHQRVKALMANGETEATVKIIKGWTEKQKERFVIQDNLQNGDWDQEILSTWDQDDLSDWGLEITPDEMEQPLDLDADDIDEGLYIKISFKSEYEANRFLDEMRDEINKYDCSMTTHGGAL